MLEMFGKRHPCSYDRHSAWHGSVSGAFSGQPIYRTTSAELLYDFNETVV